RQGSLCRLIQPVGLIGTVAWRRGATAGITRTPAAPGREILTVGFCLVSQTSVEAYISAMSPMVSGWRCRCGVRVLAVGRASAEGPAEELPVSVACPKCGDVHTCYAAR